VVVVVVVRETVVVAMDVVEAEAPAVAFATVVFATVALVFV
jgi:hypothetical protein